MNMENKLDNPKDQNKIIVKTVLRIPLFVILQAAILFISAGRFDLPRTWIFVAVTAAYYPVGLLILSKFNPELINQRARGIRQNTKSWDKLLMPAIIIIGGYILLIVAGLDVGRFQWSSLGIHFAVIGLSAYCISALIGNWATVTNPYFEPTVRIQRERGHQVITTGPYSVIRHPSHLAAILFPVSISLIIGSLYSLIPAIINMLLIFLRTSLEDKALKNELEGYSEYTERVKYRLLLGIW